MTEQQPRVVSGLDLWQWRDQAKTAAVAAEISPAEVDWLLQELAGIERLTLRLESLKDQAQVQLKLPLADLDMLWQQRLIDRLPVQYIAQRVAWRHFQLVVSPAVLIPRPETEELIDLAVAASKNSSEQLEAGQWVDLGTGSGAIALGLAEVFPAATIHAVDCSSAALAIASINTQRLGFTDRIQFYQGDWWQPLAILKGQVGGMVANPPYIPTALIPQLQPEVANHEPHLALDGGADGLDYIRQLIATAPDYLCQGGIWLVELMAGQAQTVAALLHDQGSYRNITIHSDLAGIERFVLAYRL